jgi:putative aldouronate transport system permease protein
MHERGEKRMKKKSKKGFLSQWQLWVMLLPGLICLIVFHYIPMYGVTIAFKDLHIGDSLFGGQWVGFKHFIRLFDSDIFPTILKNTLSITMIKNFLLWPIPIIFALIVHNCRNNAVRKTTQTLSYIPYLMSMVVVVSLLELLCNRETGIINVLLQKLGMDSVYFFGENKYFLPMYLISDVWQTMGSSAVIYIAALSAVDPQLVEAAKIDGATKLQRIWYIDLPTIRPTIVILLIMNMGKILSIGYEKVLLMQNDLNLEASEIIGTYVYKSGLVSMQYSFSAAVSLFNNVVGLILLIVANQLAKKATDSALF